MSTNVKVIRKEVDVFDNGNTTRCIIHASIDIPSSLISFASALPGWKKFIKLQTNINWVVIDGLQKQGIMLTGVGYAHRHKGDVPNPKFGEHIAVTKAQINLFKLAIKFQQNLQKFINKKMCSELNNGAQDCLNAEIKCQIHINKHLLKKTLLVINNVYFCKMLLLIYI